MNRPAAPDPQRTSDVAPIEARRAERRVRAYLRTYGIEDPARLATLTGEILASCDVGPDLASRAMAAAQKRVAVFLEGLLSETPHVEPLWLRAFIAAHPEHFLGAPGPAREAAAHFGDLASGDLPRAKQFAQQRFGHAAIPGWMRGLLPAASVLAALAMLLLWELSRDGLSALELIFGLVFVLVQTLPVLGAATAIRGFCTRRRETPKVTPDALPQCVVVMPIYHEDPEETFARVAAMREALSLCPGGDRFDMFVLSDSRSIASAADEERAVRRVAALPTGGRAVPLYYRRRSQNLHQKSGNLAEFFERFGHRYTYAVILDADSLMTAQTMVELACRMEAQPQVGLMQAALMLHRTQSLFARTQQLVTSVCGPLFMRGLYAWAGPHGNYYGHNAIIRISAFLECCALPLLPGPPPFGGHFLSHDFIEAALLCRGGYEVRAAVDLQDSWEEMPQSLPDYAARDRRWCQGNLQHLRIVLGDGLTSMSRIHLLIGAWSFLSAPVLLLFLLLGAVLWGLGFGSPLRWQVMGLLIATTALSLITPRVLGALEVLIDGERRRAHGGALRLLPSLALETLISTLIAPVLLAHHTRAVLSIMAGRSVGWKAQNRGAAGQLWDSLRLEWPTMLGGALAAIGAFCLDLSLCVWLSPLWGPALLAGPISALVSSAALGDLTRRMGLLSTPADLRPHRLARRVDEMRRVTDADEAARFRDCVLNPLLLRAHLTALSQRPPAPPSEDVAQTLTALRAKALKLGPAGLSRAEREALWVDAESMRALHLDAWRRWPVEDWVIETSPSGSDEGSTAPHNPLTPRISRPAVE